MKNVFLKALAASLIFVSVSFSKTISIKVSGGAEYAIDVTGSMTLDQVRATLERRSGKTLRLLALKDGDARAIDNYAEVYDAFSATGAKLVARADSGRAAAGHHGKTQDEVDGRASGGGGSASVEEKVEEKAPQGPMKMKVVMPHGRGQMEFDFEATERLGDLRARVWEALDAAMKGDLSIIALSLGRPATATEAVSVLNNSERMSQFHDGDQLIAVLRGEEYIDEEAQASAHVTSAHHAFKAMLAEETAKRQARLALERARARVDHGTGVTIDVDKQDEGASPDSGETEFQRKAREMRERRAAVHA